MLIEFDVNLNLNCDVIVCNGGGSDGDLHGDRHGNLHGDLSDDSVGNILIVI